MTQPPAARRSTGSQLQRNPIRRLGGRPTRGCTLVPDELIRHGVPEIKAEGLAVMVLLLSHANGWETSAVEMSHQLGWGENRRRVRAALERLVKARRLVIREHRRDGGGRLCQEYIFHADARRFSEEEWTMWAAPIVLPAHCKVHQYGAGRLHRNGSG